MILYEQIAHTTNAMQKVSTLYVYIIYTLFLPYLTHPTSVPFYGKRNKLQITTVYPLERRQMTMQSSYACECCYHASISEEILCICEFVGKNAALNGCVQNIVFLNELCRGTCICESAIQSAHTTRSVKLLVISPISFRL